MYYIYFVYFKCILIIGNLENYEINNYFLTTVIPRLKNYLFNFNPLPV